MSRELLVAKGVSAGYHGHPIVHDLDLVVHEGEVVVLLGPNGAGKTTTLLTLSGDLPHLGGEVVFDGRPTTAPLHRRAHAGLSFVTEERSVFMRLSVAENLRVGRTDVGRALELFPELKPLMRRRAGLLSGGEQQMLSLARALVARPRLLMLDEPSLGLAPTVVRELFGIVRHLNAEEGLSVLVVEQNANIALEASARAYVLEVGRVAVEGTSAELRRHEGVRKSYLGY
jgi:branched-chain amino acid transport system ATP-binding protein